MKDLNKVLSGKILVKIRDNVLIVHQPDATIRYLADFFADDIYEDAFKKGVYIQEELEDLIIENGWWAQEKEDELKQIPKDIEQMKVDYFNNFIRDETRAFIKKALEKKKTVLKNLHRKNISFSIIPARV